MCKFKCQINSIHLMFCLFGRWIWSSWFFSFDWKRLISYFNAFDYTDFGCLRLLFSSLSLCLLLGVWYDAKCFSTAEGRTEASAWCYLNVMWQQWIRCELLTGCLFHLLLLDFCDYTFDDVRPFKLTRNKNKKFNSNFHFSLSLSLFLHVFQCSFCCT